MSLWPRKKYSLRNCNPAEKRIRREINELDFKAKFPFYSFDKDKIDMSLLRRFLYQNDIKAYHLYTDGQIEQCETERSKVRGKDRIFIASDNVTVVNRFDIMDME